WRPIDPARRRRAMNSPGVKSPGSVAVALRRGRAVRRSGRWTAARAVMADETKNYITPAGFRRLQEELARLWKVERPPVVTTVAWAAGNGDRSENGDYIYGKRRLREIDRR